MDGSVVWRLWFAWSGRPCGVGEGIREDEVSGNARPGSGFRMAGGIAVDGNAAGVAADFGIGMGEAVVQQLVGRLFSGLGALGLS